MNLFPPRNLKPLAPTSNLENWNDQAENALANTEFFRKPKRMENRKVHVDYYQL